MKHPLLIAMVALTNVGATLLPPTQPGDAPYNPKIIRCGEYDHAHNIDYPDVMQPFSYNGEYGFTQSNERCVYYVAQFPVEGWYRVRLTCQNFVNPTTTSGYAGGQLAIWRPEDMVGTNLSAFYYNQSPYFTTGGGLLNLFQSQEVYFYATAGWGGIVVDGHGYSQGKYYLHLDRVQYYNNEVQLLPDPYQTPYPAESTIIID